jgi:hypothetical protein
MLVERGRYFDRLLPPPSSLNSSAAALECATLVALCLAGFTPLLTLAAFLSLILLLTNDYWGAIAKSCNRTVFRSQYSEFRSYIPTRYDSYPGVVYVLLVEDIQAGCDFWRKLLGINSEC